MHDTEVGKAGFITALYIVLVPMIGLALGRRTGWLVWAAVAVAIGGLWFLCVPPEGFSVRLGDLYTLLCAFVFSLHILVISHFVTKVNGRRARLRTVRLRLDHRLGGRADRGVPDH